MVEPRVVKIVSNKSVSTENETFDLLKIKSFLQPPKKRETEINRKEKRIETVFKIVNLPDKRFMY